MRRRSNRVIGRCLLVYSGHGRERHRSRRDDGQPKGSRTAYQGDPGPHALARHDRWRGLPQPPHAPLYGTRHHRGCIPRSSASEGSLASWQHFSMQAAASLPRVGRCCVDPNALEWGIGCFWLYGNGVMRNPALGLRRISLPRTWVNKDHQTRLNLLVNEEHTLAKQVRRGLDTGLGVHILRTMLFELLVCGGKLAGHERFTSARCHYEAHSGSFFDEPPPPQALGCIGAGALALPLAFAVFCSSGKEGDQLVPFFSSTVLSRSALAAGGPQGSTIRSEHRSRSRSACCRHHSPELS